MKEHRPNVALVLGTAMLVFGLSGYVEGRRFDDESRGYLVVGAAVVAAGVLGYRARRTP